MVDGDMVMLMRSMSVPEPSEAGKTYQAFQIDVFRFENGKLAEHWDTARKQPPLDEVTTLGARAVDGHAPLLAA
jgi:predicted SnoaL-like aldol condensation-catalyzing enzyme